MCYSRIIIKNNDFDKFKHAYLIFIRENNKK